MEQSVISIRNIVQRRPHFHLGPIDLDIPQGYVTAIVGPNGSGKTSLFRMMLDLAKPDEGQIAMFGEMVGERDDWRLKQRIGYVPDEAFDLDDELKAEQKAAFTRQWYPEWDARRYQELLRQFEIDTGIKLGKMSKGMRRKFDLSVAMAHNPDLLLLDEPSSGLDPIAWKTLIDVLHRYMENGERTVVIASHIVEEVKRLADYIVFIVNGRIAGQFEKDNLLESWYTLLVDTDGKTADWSLLPGCCRTEHAGGGMYRLVTSEAARAEAWLAGADVRIAGRQKLELDDILAEIVQRERLRIRS